MTPEDELTGFEAESVPKVNTLAESVGSRTLARLLAGWADEVRTETPDLRV